MAPDGDTVGELEVRGATLMNGYLGQPEATAALYTADGWLRTGDVACVDAAGWYRIVGRQSTDLIKSGGYRIGAGEVEAALLAHPGVHEAAVIGVPDDDLGQAIVAFVVADGATGPELCDFVAGTLSVHKRPRRVELVDRPAPQRHGQGAEGRAASATNMEVPGSVPEWPKGADCKSAGTAYGGSNPSRPTTTYWLLTGGVRVPGGAGWTACCSLR